MSVIRVSGYSVASSGLCEPYPSENSELENASSVAVIGFSVPPAGRLLLRLDTFKPPIGQ